MSSPRTWWQETRAQCRRHPRAALCLLVGYVVAIALGAYYFGFRHWWAGQRWQEAEQSLAAGEFAAARDQLRACLSVWSKDGRAHFAMAQACRHLEDFDAAGKHLEHARRLGHAPTAVALEWVLGEVQQTGGGELEATIIRPFLENRCPEEPLVLEALAIGLRRNRRFRDAAAWLNRWVERYPDDWRAYRLRGALYYEMGRLEVAQHDFDKALELRPGNRDVQRQLGLVLAKSGNDVERGVQVLEEYLRHRPDDHYARIMLARSRRRYARYDDARAALTHVITAGVEAPSLSILMGQIEADEDNLAEALRWLELAERQGSEDPEEINVQYSTLSNLHRRLGRPEKAQAYEQKLQDFHDNLRLLNEALDTQLSKGSNPELSFKIAMLYLRLGVVSEGVRWLEGLIRAQPRDRRHYQALVDFFAQRSDAVSQQRAEQYRSQLAQLDSP